MTIVASGFVHVVGTVFAICALASTHWSSTQQVSSLGLFSANGATIDSSCTFTHTAFNVTETIHLPDCSTFNAVRAFCTLSVLAGIAHIIMGALYYYSEQVAVCARDFHMMSITGAFAGGCKFIGFISFSSWAHGSGFDTSGSGFALAVVSGCIHVVAVIVRLFGQQLLDKVMSVCC